MKPIIFINLPVKNLKASMEFYSNIGFTNNSKYTDETAACMVFSEEIMVMLLTHEKFKTFTSKTIADTSTQVQVLNALALESREKVDELTEAAYRAGATEARPTTDYGFMYGTAINDPDGHIWEFFWMKREDVEDFENELEHKPQQS